MVRDGWMVLDDFGPYQIIEHHNEAGMKQYKTDKVHVL